MLTEGVCVHPCWLNSAKDTEWYLKSIISPGSLACMTSLQIEMVVRHMDTCSIGEFLPRLVGSCVFDHCQLLVPACTSKTGHFLLALGLRPFTNAQNRYGGEQPTFS